MLVSQGSNNNPHQHLCKSDTKILSPLLLLCQPIRFVEITKDLKVNVAATEKYGDKVISITAAIKPARKPSQVTFKYPMLECS